MFTGIITSLGTVVELQPHRLVVARMGPPLVVGLGEDGTHAMFMDLTKQLKEGEKIEAVLVFEKAGRVPVVFNVEKRSAQKNERHEHQQ